MLALNRGPKNADKVRPRAGEGRNRNGPCTDGFGVPGFGTWRTAAHMVCQRQSDRGFSLTDTLVASVVLVIAILGNSGYRYQSLLSAQRADRWKTAATTAQFLCQSWAGTQGIGTFNPVSALGSGITIAADVGPSAGAGFTSLGSYHIDLNGDRYFATLAWQDVAVRAAGAECQGGLGPKQVRQYDLRGCGQIICPDRLFCDAVEDLTECR